MNDMGQIIITGDYHFFYKNRSKAIRTLKFNSDNKHFVNDLPTHAKTQIFPCKNIKFTC